MKNHVVLCKNLRKNQTPAESVFWELVRNNQISGKRFLRQHVFWFEIDGIKRYFVADFYCASSRLIIEIDGPIHDQQRDYDDYRTELLLQRDLKVLRFSNEEVLSNIDLTLKKLKSHM
jgi:very-short-patch-repair endonuclease